MAQVSKRDAGASITENSSNNEDVPAVTLVFAYLQRKTTRVLLAVMQRTSCMTSWLTSTGQGKNLNHNHVACVAEGMISDGKYVLIKKKVLTTHGPQGYDVKDNQRRFIYMSP